MDAKKLALGVIPFMLQKFLAANHRLDGWVSLSRMGRIIILGGFGGAGFWDPSTGCLYIGSSRGCLTVIILVVTVYRRWDPDTKYLSAKVFFCFRHVIIFTPTGKGTWGNDQICGAYFSNGLVQPPTRGIQRDLKRDVCAESEATRKLLKTPENEQMSPQERCHFKRKGSSSNHCFLGDMLIFGGVC